MGEARVVWVSAAVREGVRGCLRSKAPLATLALFMQKLRASGAFSQNDALTIERTVIRVLRKSLPEGVEGVWHGDATLFPLADDPVGRTSIKPAEA